MNDINDIAAPEAIFFDWDGTLVDSYPLIVAAHDYARDRLSLPPFAPNEFRPYFGKPRDLIYKTLYTGQENAARAYFEDFIFAHHEEHLNPMDGAETLLSAIKKNDLQIAVISNKKAELLRAEIKALGWGHYFSAILGSGDTERDKPDPQPLYSAAKTLNMHAQIENIWYVGDTDVDIRSAHNAGCLPILLRDTPLEMEYQPKLIFNNCKELHAFMLQCLEKPLKRTV